MLLDKIIEENSNENYLDKEYNFIQIIPEYKQALSDFIPGIRKFNEKAKIIYAIIKTFKKKYNITLKNICKKYKKKTGNYISKSYVYLIITNKLKYRFLKTITKPICLNSISSKIIFISTIVRALKIGLKIIYLDESNFQLENNHLRIWRKMDELPYFKVGGKGRKNIILAISNEELILYKINQGTNNADTFYEFMKELIEAIRNKKIEDSLIIMDNCTIHMTKKLKELYRENKLKVLTIVPYSSDFNAVEYVFNYLKQKVYKKVFISLNKLMTFVETELIMMILMIL